MSTRCRTLAIGVYCAMLLLGLSKPLPILNKLADHDSRGFKKIVCSRCHQSRHYQNTCMVFMDISHDETVLSDNQSRKRKKCGIVACLGILVELVMTHIGVINHLFTVYFEQILCAHSFLLCFSWYVLLLDCVFLPKFNRRHMIFLVVIRNEFW